MGVDFQRLDKVLQSLRCALDQPPLNDLERDGVVQRFECCFELLWKTSKRVLHSVGIEPASPRSVIRDLARQGFINDAEEWDDAPGSQKLHEPHIQRGYGAMGFLEVLRFLVAS
jgi:nucleotidyltransferase substrate binding protein (TIGR01987 family)